MRVAAILAGLLLLATSPGPFALAQPSGVTAISETGLATTFTPATAMLDAAGNKIYQGTVYEGSLSGSPISGTFRLIENAFVAAGSVTGASEGSFVLRDSADNSLTGTMTSQVQLGGAGSSANGQFAIQDGTGIFADASGGGDFTATISAPGQTPVLTFMGNVFGANVFHNTTPGTLPDGSVILPNVTNADRLGLPSSENVVVPANQVDNIRPGNGFGDPNHFHTGPGSDDNNPVNNTTSTPVNNVANNPANNGNGNGNGNSNGHGNGNGHGHGRDH